MIEKNAAVMRFGIMSALYVIPGIYVLDVIPGRGTCLPPLLRERQSDIRMSATRIYYSLKKTRNDNKFRKTFGGKKMLRVLDRAAQPQNENKTRIKSNENLDYVHSFIQT